MSKELMSMLAEGCQHWKKRTVQFMTKDSKLDYEMCDNCQRLYEYLGSPKNIQFHNVRKFLQRYFSNRYFTGICLHCKKNQWLYRVQDYPTRIHEYPYICPVYFNEEFMMFYCEG